MLQLCKISKHFKQNIVLNEISLDLNSNEFFSLLGPSGSGKSTLLKIIAGLEIPTKGTLSSNNVKLSDANQLIVAPEKRHISYVFQEPSLFPHLNVYENISIALKEKDPKERKKTINVFMDFLKIQTLSEKYAHQLSGGEAQRVAVARALASKPRWILLDEPFSNLDHQIKFPLLQELKLILKSLNVSAILVTHNQEEAFAFSNKIALLNKGQIEQFSQAEDLYFQPKSLWVGEFIGDSCVLNYEEAEELKINFNKEALSQLKSSHFFLRPEDFFLLDREKAASSEGVSTFLINEVWFKGHSSLLGIHLNTKKRIWIHAPSSLSFKIGDPLFIKVKKFSLFPKEKSLDKDVLDKDVLAKEP